MTPAAPRSWQAALALSLLLAGAAWERWGSFRLPHFRGDEPVYLGLSLALAERGWGGYSLRHLDAWVEPLPSREGRGLARVTIRPGPERRGGLIAYYASGGEDYHDRPRSSYGPGLPGALWAARALLGPERPAVLALDPGLSEAARAAGRLPQAQAELTRRAVAGRYPEADRVAAEQRFAAWPSLLASLIGIAATFALALQLTGSPGWALLAGALLATAPVELLAAHLVQSDALAAGLGALGLALGARALRPGARPAPGWAAACGAVLGLAVLAKPQAALLGVAWFAAALRPGPTPLARRLPALAAFAAPALLLSGPWVLSVGLGATPELQADHGARGAFGSWVSGRPWWIYAVHLGWFSPPLLLGLLLLAPPVRRAAPRRPGSRALTALCLLALAGFLLATAAYPTRENRYLLPAYPALALLAVQALRGASALARARLGPVGPVLVLAPVLGLLARSRALGLEAVLSGRTHWNAETLLGLR